MTRIVRVAIPIRHRGLFDYTIETRLQVGCRVIVPFGRNRMLAVVCECPLESDYPLEKLRAVEEVLDSVPAISASLMATIRWAAQHYQQPIGEILSTALPKAIRSGRALHPKFDRLFELTVLGRKTDSSTLSTASLEQQLFE